MKKIEFQLIQFEEVLIEEKLLLPLETIEYYHKALNIFQIK